MSATRLIFGFHAVTSRLRQNPDSIKEIFFDEGRNDQRIRSLINIAETQKVSLIACDSDRLDKMAGSRRHQGVAAAIDAFSAYVSIDD
ncbi:MAG: 23S rRNA (guanosine(2251)-2'-O)-methyltransferase RlmB, partial [Nitrosomonas sp.]|nr:23S rRNA (guanosine(2251)-2'-O)-methyltransferase RlmB [Nitrosomonas sp.]